MTSLPKTGAKLVRNLLSRFRRDTDGVVAIEFAFIVPVLILLYAGVFQLSMVIIQARNVSHSSSVMGDLATQSTGLDETGAADVMSAALAILQISNVDVLNNGDVQIQLISYDVDPATSAPRELGRAETPGFVGTEAVLPADIDAKLLSSTSGAVVARVKYTYRFLSNGSGTNNPFKGGFFGETAVLEEHFIYKPRLGNTLPIQSASDGSKTTLSCTIGGVASVSCTAA